MKISKIASILLASSVAFIIGCGGGGGGSSSSSSATSTGTFEDAPVKGLYYKTSSGITGITDENGTFKYKSGDKVTFKIGNLILGTSYANSITTPYDLSNDTNTAIYIAYFLQNLDIDGNVNNGIQLPSDVNVSDIDFSNEENVTNTLNNIKSQLKNRYSFPDISIEDAKNNLISNIQHKVFIKVSDIVNKVWYFVEVNPISYAADIIEMKFDLNSGRLQMKVDGKWIDNDYIEKVNDYVLKDINIDENNETRYVKFYKINNGWVAYMSDEVNGVYEKKPYYFFDSYESAESFINSINKDMQKITSFDQINNKWFYQIAISDKGELSSIAIEINGSKAKECFYDGELTTNLTYCYKENQIDFKDEKFGFYDDEDGEWKYNDVYKIPLTGKTLNIETLENEEVFDENGLAKYFKDNNLSTNITFTKGYMYCDLLWQECWLDKDAMESLINDIYKVTKIYTYKYADYNDSTFVKDLMFTNNNKCLSFREGKLNFFDSYYLNILNLQTKEIKSFQMVDDMNSSNSFMEALLKNGNYIYLTHNEGLEHFLRIYKINENCELEHINDINLTKDTYAGYEMSIDNNTLVIGGNTYEFAFYNITDPENPVFIKKFKFEDYYDSFTSYTDLAYVENKIFYLDNGYRPSNTTYSILRVYDEEINLTKEFNLSKLITDKNLIDAKILVNNAKNYLYLHDSYSGRIIGIDLSNLDYKDIDSGLGAGYAQVAENNLYVSEINGKFNVFDTSIPSAPTLIRHFVLQETYDNAFDSTIINFIISNDEKYLVVNATDDRASKNLKIYLIK